MFRAVIFFGWDNIFEFGDRFELEPIMVGCPHFPIVSNGFMVGRINDRAQAVLVDKVAVPHQVTKVNFLI